MSEPTLDLVLDPPIKVGGKTYDGLQLREPTAGMVAKAEKELGLATLYTVRRYQIALVAVTAGVPRAVVRAMPVRQLNDAMSFLTAFIVPSSDPAQPAEMTKPKRRSTKRRARKAAPQ